MISLLPHHPVIHTIPDLLVTITLLDQRLEKNLESKRSHSLHQKFGKV
jgi:hypothetical protein